jgi:nitrogen fixation protein FixH
MVLVGLLAFFGVVFAVNGVFVYLAMDSWPGLTTEAAYEQGLAHDQSLAEAEAQAQRGWYSDLTIAPLAGGNGQRVTARMTGKDDDALESLTITVTLVRPVGDETAVSAVLNHQGGGLYRADVALPHPGRWRAEITAHGEDGAPYRMVYDVMVAP